MNSSQGEVEARGRPHSRVRRKADRTKATPNRTDRTSHVCQAFSLCGCKSAGPDGPNSLPEAPGGT
eukprot:396225-Alexandrium_andersonii.AAC.1